ncbi:MAG: cation-transporting P-type ATPase [Candidatus Dojkabacteria bacterium]|nr:MAG: cation-transporting P-type ATPase [Candidatus Dojkabacteria bacterium]
MTDFISQSAENIVSFFNSSEKDGLSHEQIPANREKFGSNVLFSKKKPGILSLFIAQLTNPIVIILLLAVVLAAFTGKIFEASLIGGIVLFMAVIGVYLEYNADKAVDKLKSLTELETTVIREGKSVKIPASEVVVGDLLYLVEGDRVPADARVIQPIDLAMDESMLTGESLPVKKTSQIIDKDTTLAERTNMIFSGTFTIQGSVKAIVTAVGNNTELGAIAQKLEETEDEPTPLQLQLEKLSKFLFWATIILCSVIFGVTLLRGESLIDGAIEALSLAIAFIPEGLTAVMTVVLALGVREMVQKKAIIKRLVAAEGMGSVSLLGTDKTGTITQGTMTVEKLWVFNKEIDAENFTPETPLDKRIMEVIQFCNNSKGATELALVNFLSRKGLSFELTERKHEHRFSSDVKRMSIVKDIDGKLHSYAKGAPDVLIPLCEENYAADHTLTKLTEKEKEIALAKAEELASQGYRVLCLAYRELPETKDISNRDEVETELVFLGLVALMDPLRPDVAETVAVLKTAGIVPIMITGDHPAIAKTIALSAGIISSENEKVLSGKDLDLYLNGKIVVTEQDIVNTRVFARVTPYHKQELVKIFKKAGFTVAMAGDGINDAIAVKTADIGIGVANATDIIKEASDVIITGSYSALASAVEVGRLIMFRTRLYLHYLLSGNVCQVGVFILALVFNLPSPLSPVSLLIINLLTDAAPAMAMAAEKGDKNVMNKPPKPKAESIITRRITISTLVLGLISSIFLFAVFYLLLPYGLVLAQTATFTAYIFQKLLRGFTARSFDSALWHYGIFTNKLMTISIAIGFAIWGAIVFIFPSVFSMTTLPLHILGIIAGFSLILPVTEEILKAQLRISQK